MEEGDIRRDRETERARERERTKGEKDGDLRDREKHQVKQNFRSCPSLVRVLRNELEI